MFYSGIHALRALAALLVVVHHAMQRNQSFAPGGMSFEFGAWGVDLFFVISGFVMAKGVAGRQGAAAAVDFMGRRVARVVPLYWAATLLLAAVFFAAPTIFGNFVVLPLDVLKSLLFIPYEDARGYVRPVLSQGWTLIFEMFFYALVCVGLLFGRGRAMWLAAGLIGGLVMLGYLLAQRSGATPFLCSGILLEFLFGALAFHYAPRAARLATWQLAGLAVAGVLFSYLLVDLLSLGVGRALAGGGGAFLVVFAMIGLQASTGMVLPRLLRLLGDASYAIYLFHGIGFSLVVKLLGMRHWQSPELVILVLTVGGTLCGIAVHLLFENRLQRYATVTLTRIGLIARANPRSMQ